MASKGEFQGVIQFWKAIRLAPVYRWTGDATRRKIKEIDKETMFKNHISGVVNALLTNLNNNMAEQLRGKIQKLKTIGKDYRTFNNVRSAILFYYGG